MNNKISGGQEAKGYSRKRTLALLEMFSLVKNILERNDTMLPIGVSLVFLFIYFFI